MRRAVLTLAVTTVSAGLAAAGSMTACSGGTWNQGEPESEPAAQPLREPLVKDAGVDCKAAIKKLMSSPITPPNKMGGLNLAGTDADGSVSGGGITFASTDLSSCVQYQDPQKEAYPSYPGYRTAGFTNAADAGDASLDPNDPVSITYNEQSHVIEQVALNGSGVTSTLNFHSRAGGAYGTGHHYVVSLSNGEGGAGSVAKDGANFKANWGYVLNDAGTAYEASAWANEIYDGILATFLPTFPAATTGDCLTSLYTADFQGAPNPNTPECLYYPANGGSYLGVRPLGLYMIFQQGTNHTQTVYQDWPGGFTSCATPNAALEAMDFQPIYWGTAYNDKSAEYGSEIGDINLNEAYSHPGGITATEANEILGCGGVTATAPDPGYSAMTWGAKNEILLEYNTKTGVGYKLFGQAGFSGAMVLQSAAPTDGGAPDTYSLGIGALTKNGSAYTIDWTTAGSAEKSVTPISNALLVFEGLAPDTGLCSKTGDCSVVLDDGAGHSTFTLSPTGYGAAQGLTWVFAKGTSVPVEVYTVNPSGM